MNYVFGHHYEWKVIKEPRYVMKTIRCLVVKSFRCIMKLIHFIMKFKLYIPSVPVGGVLVVHPKLFQTGSIQKSCL